MAIKNVKTVVSKNILTITVDLSQKGSPSKSGKSTLVASTGGFAEVEGAEGVKIGLNVIKAE